MVVQVSWTLKYVLSLRSIDNQHVFLIEEYILAKVYRLFITVQVNQMRHISI
jgi:hypothetical protein